MVACIYCVGGSVVVVMVACGFVLMVVCGCVGVGGSMRLLCWW